MRLAACLAAALLAAPVAGRALDLALPIACDPGEDCWIPRYVDVDPGPAVTDFACGKLSGEDHDGTDFAIPNFAAMRAGVPVLAAAAGTVIRTRDGVRDVDVQTIDRASIAGRECGNGVVLRHADGWETQYCHLRRGSVAVGRGESVEAGTVLGMVGMSGEASFPHVHFTVREDGRAIDPFTGGAPGEAACGGGGTPLWTTDVAYAPAMFNGFGVAAAAPDWEAVKEGQYGERRLAASAPVLVGWVEGYGLKAGDAVRLTITDPAGAVVYEGATKEDRDRARFFRYMGRRAPDGGFAPGGYEAAFVLERGGQPLIERSLPFRVE